MRIGKDRNAVAVHTVYPRYHLAGDVKLCCSVLCMLGEAHRRQACGMSSGPSVLGNVLHTLASLSKFITTDILHGDFARSHSPNLPTSHVRPSHLFGAAGREWEEAGRGPGNAPQSLLRKAYTSIVFRDAKRGSPFAYAALRDCGMG